MAVNIEKNEQGWRVTSDETIWILICDETYWYFYFEHIRGFVDIGSEIEPKIFQTQREALDFIKDNNLIKIEVEEENIRE